MLSEEEKSRDKILKAARKEFLVKGFQGASLRTIARDAGVTTGSLYWHFKNKDELFDAIVGEHYAFVMNVYQNWVDRFFAMTPEVQKSNGGDIGNSCIFELLEYVYQHKTDFKILIDGSAGTKYENLLHELTEAEIESTRRFARQMEDLLGFKSRNILPELEHILVSGMFAGIFELVKHDIPIGTARECAKGVHDFHRAGWKYLLNIPEE